MIVIFYSCPVWPLNIWEFKRRPSASSSAPAGAILCLGINALNMRRRFRSSPSVSLFETIEVATEARAIEAEFNFPTDYRYICAGLIASGQLRALSPSLERGLGQVQLYRQRLYQQSRPAYEGETWGRVLAVPHMVDAVGMFHAGLLRIQALVLPIKDTSVFGA